MPTYTLNVNVDPKQVQSLRNQGYSLCLAKLTKGQAQANVIWNSNSEFLHFNYYSWEDAYSVAGTDSVEPGTLVDACTVKKPIGLGQTVAINADGDITDPSGAITPGTGFTVTNNDAAQKLAAVIYVAITDMSGEPASLPFFVSDLLENTSSTEILPIEKVVLWFGQQTGTGTIIADYPGPSLTVPYDDAVSHTAHWTDAGEWKLAD